MPPYKYSYGIRPYATVCQGFFIFYKCKWLKFIKDANYDVASKFGNTLTFVDYLIAINDGNEFENHYYEIYPFEIALKKEILHTPRLLF